MPVHWQTPAQVNALPEHLQDWLLNTGSLTERLQALTDSFSVNLLGQSSEGLDSSEQEMLSTSTMQNWQVREVILQGSPKGENKQQDWVFARSVLPNKLCESTWANLGSQPLGQRIFNDPNFVRSEFEIGKLRYNPVLLDDYSQQNIWARRSKFTIDTFELIVAEAFLPQCPAYW
jgi:chorismate--pyruvate lyase